MPPSGVVIVKVGGAAITAKDEIESLDDANLDSIVDLVRRAAKESGIGLILVHGAGSFGHHHARQSGISGAALDSPERCKGFASTRLSVQTLNLIVVRRLVDAGIDAVALSPFSAGGWARSDDDDDSALDASAFRSLLDAGMVPCIHGDAILTAAAPGERIKILSGDEIVQRLASSLASSVVGCVFITNTFGIYSAPPECEGAQPVPEIVPGGAAHLKFDVSKTDVTGGMAGKLASALKIARGGVRVLITKVASPDAARAVVSFDAALNDPDWRGTRIHDPDASVSALK